MRPKTPEPEEKEGSKSPSLSPDRSSDYLNHSDNTLDPKSKQAKEIISLISDDENDKNSKGKQVTRVLPIRKHNNTRDNNDESDNEFDIYNDIAHKKTRYYIPNNITVKCYNCNEVGHISDTCPNNTVLICTRCHENGHLSPDCDNFKCFRCNKRGHKRNFCTTPKEKIFTCQACNQIGHKKIDCLKKPPAIDLEYLTRNCTCFICGSNEHLLCNYTNGNHNDINDVRSLSSHSQNESAEGQSDYEIPKRRFLITADSENSYGYFNNVDEDDYLESGEIVEFDFSSLPEKEFYKVVSCYKCAEVHNPNECNVQLKKINNFDRQRDTYSNSFSRPNYEERKKDEDNYDLELKENLEFSFRKKRERTYDSVNNFNSEYSNNKKVRYNDRVRNEYKNNDKIFHNVNTKTNNLNTFQDNINYNFNFNPNITVNRTPTNISPNKDLTNYCNNRGGSKLVDHSKSNSDKKKSGYLDYSWE